MIHLIVGDDTYASRQELAKITNAVKLTPEIYDGLDIDENQLADLIAGGNLFNAQRLVVIKELSANKGVWDKLADWTARVSADTQLVLLELKLDKRLKSYKTISAAATIHLAEPWTDRRFAQAVAWTLDQAGRHKVLLSKEQAELIVDRATRPGDDSGYQQVIDRQLIDNTLGTLSLAGVVTQDALDAVLPYNPSSNVFSLLDLAFRRDAAAVKAKLSDLHVAADPYMTFGYIASQWSQFVVLKTVKGSVADAVEATGAKPFTLEKLAPHINKISSPKTTQLTTLLAKLDFQIKTTSLDAWTAVDRFIAELMQE